LSKEFFAERSGKAERRRKEFFAERSGKAERRR
jgi:hypothetical protein